MRKQEVLFVLEPCNSQLQSGLSRNLQNLPLPGRLLSYNFTEIHALIQTTWMSTNDDDKKKRTSWIHFLRSYKTIWLFSLVSYKKWGWGNWELRLLIWTSIHIKFIQEILNIYACLSENIRTPGDNRLRHWYVCVNVNSFAA